MDPSRMWLRQERRGDLVDAFWHLAGGRPGWRVADVGCGPGYFALRYALLTGPTGHIHAVDEDPEALAYLRSRMDPDHHAHVTTEQLDIVRASLPDLHFDALFCTNALHHMADIPAALRNLRQTGAPLIIAEFDPNAPGDTGPPIEMRLDPADLTEHLRNAGWVPQPWAAFAHEEYVIVSR